MAPGQNRTAAALGPGDGSMCAFSVDSSYDPLQVTGPAALRELVHGACAIDDLR
jgi:hypothetical protein